MMTFGSWEFIFFSNIILALLFPILKRKSAYWISFTLIVVFSFTFSPHPIDRIFYLQLCSLHLGVSALAIYLLNGSCRNLKTYYLLLFLSLGLTLTYPLRPTLLFLDPFWGVLPGTIHLDPMIDFMPYMIRAALFLISFSIWISYRTILAFYGTWLIAAILLGTVFPTSWSFKPLTIGPSLKNRSVGIELSSSPTVTQNQKKFWLKELSFLRRDLQSQLKLDSFPPINIQVFGEHDEKYRSIGARETQIGHFLRKEIYVSGVSPIDPIIRHEMTHILHRQLNAPLYSYLDPFYFEGLAEALSADQDLLIRRSAAIVDQLKNQLQWPKGLLFFSAYPMRISYTLAGAWAALMIRQNLWPWSQSPSIDPFLNIETLEADREWARRQLSRPSLFSDPSRRDCYRLEHDFYDRSSPALLTKIEKICPSFKERPAFKPSPRFEDALHDEISRVQDPILRGTQIEFYEKLMLGETISENDLVRLEKKLSSSGSSTETFRRRLLWEKENLAP